MAGTFKVLPFMILSISVYRKLKNLKGPNPNKQIFLAKKQPSRQLNDSDSLFCSFEQNNKLMLLKLAENNKHFYH